MVFVQLSDEEKLQVLLLAFTLFLLALILSVCLAFASCPLNKWLLERRSRKRRKLAAQIAIQPPSACLVVGHHNSHHHHHYLRQSIKNPCSRTSHQYHHHYAGPPPAYEAALRATRLSSLTGQLSSSQPSTGSWLQQQHRSAEVASVLGVEKELDFGDYFHPPKEEQVLASQVSCAALSALPSSQWPLADDGTKKLPPAPVMLRLWVRVMEPGEIVSRVRRMTSASDGSAGSCRRLSRQLSIPQLFGSLVTLAGKLQMSSLESGEPAVSAGKAQGQTDLASFTSASSSNDSSLERPSCATLENSSGSSAEEAAAQRKPEQEASVTSAAATSEQSNNIPARPTRLRLPADVPNPITSRVLHMNVASFSYVKDESLISSKRHSQLNNHQFNSQQFSSCEATAASGSGSGARGKHCQLVVSICDVENVLRSSWMQQRSCALLTGSSSVYIQCEILVPESNTSRILRYPLRALQQEVDSTHTVSFTAATAVPMAPATGDRATVIALNRTEGEQVSSPVAEPATDPESATKTQTTTAATNWRHEPSADGKSIVVFNSVAKPIEPPASSTDLGAPDLIQFDSVFVSPILSKSSLEEGSMRVRVYSQCKYVNETCLAELKLPLKRLLRGDSADNLSDASGANSRQPQQQADFILNNLLTNLVTASTGSPLATLMDRYSSGHRADESTAAAGRWLTRGAHTTTTTTTTTTNGSGGSFRLPWRGSSGLGATQVGALRSSHSFNDSLHRLSEEPARSLGQEAETEAERDLAEAEEEEEVERRLEQNYCRSLMVSHWLNYLVAPSYECQPIEEPRGRIILGLSYLPTSNRVIFNAHRASIDNDSYANAKQMMKNLRLQSGTCYLLRFLMVANGRVVKRKQSQVGSKPEWDSQEPITFDLVSVSVEQPTFVVALVMRNAAVGTGSLQNLGLHQLSGCNFAPNRQRSAAEGGQRRVIQCVQSEPESLQHLARPDSTTSGAAGQTGGGGGCDICRQELLASGGPAGQESGRGARGGQNRRDLVIGHLTLGEDMWREMRAQPRKQIVKQFKMY